MSAAAVIIYRQRQFVIRFLEAGATSPATARGLSELGLRTHWIFRRLARRGVFREVHPDRWYIDTAAWHRFEHGQRQRLLIFAFFAFAAAFVLLLILLLR